MNDGIVILDPTQDPEPAEARSAPRLAEIAGKRVGLLANGRPKAAELLEIVAADLAARFGLAAVVRAAKRSWQNPADSVLLDQLATECDFVITAIGD